MADWSSFEKTLSGKFQHINDDAFKNAITLLTTREPQVQIVKNNTLDGGPNGKLKGDTDETWVLRLVRTVRNNLFHGGKFSSGNVDDPSRDRDLLAASHTVLIRALALAPDVKAQFDAPF